MVAVIEATKRGDATMFRDAYSARIRREDQGSDWEKHLREAQATLKEKFGDCQITDFTFSFDGDDTNGTLQVSFKGKWEFVLAVVKEGGAWKLDER